MLLFLRVVQICCLCKHTFLGQSTRACEHRNISYLVMEDLIKIFKTLILLLTEGSCIIISVHVATAFVSE